MYPIIMHIYGPIAIRSYGLAIVVGLLVFLFFTMRHPKRKRLISDDHFYSLLSWSILAGLLGGHLLYTITEIPSFIGYWHEHTIGQGFGLSILGTVIGVLTFLTIYLSYKKIPLLPFLDLVAIYAPLAQSFGRVGCFLAGCCYGLPTILPWAVTYHHHESIAPICIARHPSQLYSAGLLFIIFLSMHFFFQRKFIKPGQLISLYLILMSTERFITDFFRDDRLILRATNYIELSQHQIISVALFVGGILFFVYAGHRHGRSQDS